MGSAFFDFSLTNYCGVQLSSDMTVDSLQTLDSNLVNMSAITTGTNTLVDFAALNSNSPAVPIFAYDNNKTSAWKGGFRIHINNEGVFIYIAGRPYRFNNTASYNNYNYIIDNWMTSLPTGVKGNAISNLVNSYELDAELPQSIQSFYNDKIFYPK